MRKRMALAGIAMLGVAAAPAPTDYRLAAPIALPDGGWDYASFDAASGLVLVARSNAVSVVDPAHPQAVRSIGTIERGHAALPLPGGKHVLVTSGNDNSARILDIASGTELAKIAVGKKPDAATMDPATSDALVMDAGDGTVAVVDVKAMRLVKSIAVKPGLEAAVVARDGKLYVNDEDAGELEVVDLKRGMAEAPIALPGCEGPTGIGYDAKLDRLVSSCANGKAAVVDPAHRRVVAMVDIGKGPDTVLIDAAKGLALIPCGRDGTLDLIALGGAGGPQRVARVTTEMGARTGAIDPASGTVYLPTAHYTPPAQPGARPGIVAGSVHLVVVRRG